MRRTADIPILVWDNGSGPELRSYLMGDFRPDYLMMTPNIGKPKARQAALRMLPEETIVCFSDDDILYYPGWLQAHIELFRGFPNVGAVSGWPVRFSFGWATQSTVDFCKANGSVERGRFISDEEDKDYAVSIGVDGERWNVQNRHRQDIRVTYNGLKAYAEAQHCQAMWQAGRIAPLADNDYAPRHEEIEFDKAVDAAGLLRLTTIKRVTRHMGNVIDDKLKGELEGMGIL